MSREPVRRRRLLFNCDGCSVWQQAAGRVDAWLANVFTGLVDSQVDALLWCDGAGGNTASYDSHVLERTGARAGCADPALQAAIDAGSDPPGAVTRAARQRGLDVFYSFRINDCHDAFTPAELPTFKVAHPEWQIGADAGYGPRTALDFAWPQVRDLKVRTVEEVFARYDFDGIELDLLRGPPFFRPFREPRHAYLLTDLLRTLRLRLDQRARERGRRIEVAVRVGENPLACQLDGFDVRTWTEQDLLDVLILGSGTLDVDVEGFRRLVRGSAVRLYPCLYGWPSGYNPIPAPLARGLAATYWQQEADGIYLFNWFPHEAERREQVDLLRQIGDPGALAGKPMRFAADRGPDGRPDDYYPHNWLLAPLPAELWSTQSGTPLSVPVAVGARLRGPVRLRLQVEHLAGRTLRAAINGAGIAALVPEDDAAWLTASIAAGTLTQGVNHVDLWVEQAVEARPAPTVRSLEIDGTAL